jgi:hypothetical protein
MIVWAYLSPMGIEIIPTKVFELFGFDNPKDVDLSKFAFNRKRVRLEYYKDNNLDSLEESFYMSEEKTMDVYYYKRSLADEK